MSPEYKSWKYGPGDPDFETDQTIALRASDEFSDLLGYPVGFSWLPRAGEWAIEVRPPGETTWDTPAARPLLDDLVSWAYDHFEVEA